MVVLMAIPDAGCGGGEAGVLMPLPDAGCAEGEAGVLMAVPDAGCEVGGGVLMAISDASFVGGGEGSHGSPRLWLWGENWGFLWQSHMLVV